MIRHRNLKTAGRNWAATITPDRNGRWLCAPAKAGPAYVRLHWDDWHPGMTRIRRVGWFRVGVLKPWWLARLLTARAKL